MKEWLLSLSAAAVVMLLLEYLITGDAMQKTVKFALSLLFMLLILSPIIALLHSPIDFGSFEVGSVSAPASAVATDYETVLKAAQAKGEAYGNPQP